MNALGNYYKQIDVAVLSCLSSRCRAKEDYFQRTHLLYNFINQFIYNDSSIQLHLLSFLMKGSSQSFSTIFLLIYSSASA